MRSRGFTIVELLIVIVVIAILAAISVVAYNGIQERSRQSKVSADLSQLSKAIMAARVNTDKPLIQITGCGYTVASGNDLCNTNNGSCWTAANGTDLKTLNGCYVAYNAALNKISNASGINVTGLIDPFGRPYVLDENETENSATNCTKDYIGMFRNPHVSGQFTNRIDIPNFAPGCI